ncbi:MAG: DUF192 domain-containing protein [Vampirovibrionales bacterium]|nr:DUF192 domain-containing protein [Vampirovibrionales bacterium]
MASKCYQAVNETRQTIVAERVRMANTHWTRFWGLMGKPCLPPGDGLWLEPCADIHSFFMRFPFDAAFIDRSGKILRCVEAMRPWRASPWVRGSRVVLELPAGALAQSACQPGDIITLGPGKNQNEENQNHERRN